MGQLWKTREKRVARQSLLSGGRRRAAASFSSTICWFSSRWNRAVPVRASVWDNWLLSSWFWGVDILSVVQLRYQLLHHRYMELVQKSQAADYIF